MPITLTQIEQFRELIRAGSSVVLTTHVNPDGDGLGSQVALAAFLQQRGVAAHIINHDAVPPPYRFLDPAGSLIGRYDPAVHDPLLRSAACILIVDTNHTSRLGRLETAVNASSARTVIIDHHPDPGTFASLTLVDIDASSTGQIVYRLLDALGGLPLSGHVANALYTAVMTDTGSFRFPKTDSAVHRMVADLIDMGADPVSTYQHVYEEGPANRLQLLGEALSGLRMAHEGRVCTLTVTREMFHRTQTSEIDTDAFVPITLTVGGVQIGLMFTELEDCIKINFRSKGDIPANELARLFGGNGHRNAAGARVRGTSLEHLCADVVSRSRTFLH
jgi:phosphoesterase RecJ-like protein